jgi:hypothetical protein
MSVQTEFPEVYTNEEEALSAAVRVLGGAKKVAGRLWPSKSADDGSRELLDALNRDRPRKLELHEIFKILLWAREAGFHSAKHYFDHATGYQASSPLDPEDEKAKLQREFIASVQLQQRIAERLGVWDKLPSPLKAVI